MADRVNNPTYGLGTIKHVNEQYTTIVFDDHGTKKFLTAIVQLERTDETVRPRAARRGSRTVVRRRASGRVEPGGESRRKRNPPTEIGSIVPEGDTLLPDGQKSPDDAARDFPTRPDSKLERLARKRDQAVQDPVEIRAAIAEMNATHYAAWPDAPLPALDGQTPRTALQTTDGRERVEALLLDLERRQDSSPTSQYDFNQLRAMLGLALR